jgi:hypothetical protein
MGILDLADITDAVASRTSAVMVTAGETRLGVPPRVYSYDQLPEQPVEPYVAFQRFDSGLGWDMDLENGGRSGWLTLTVTGVGRLESAAAWALDVVRSHLLVLVPATVVLSGDTHLKTVTSQGPPAGPIEAGTLMNMVETYALYLEAS